MKKILLPIFLIILSTSLIAQTKYFIYFKDKGTPKNQSLNKSLEIYHEAEKLLSSKAIERRKSVMGENYIAFEDLPVNESYVSVIEKLGMKIENKLKWFNAVSAYLSDEQLKEINTLPFIDKIERVRNLESVQPFDSKKSDIQNLSKSNYYLDYGRSLTQNDLSEIPIVHDIGINGEGVLVGLLDSGFRREGHPALQNIKVIAEWDFINNDANTANESESENLVGQDRHGTSVLSIIAGFDPGNLIGPAYGANFLLAKTEDITSEKNVEEDNYAAALEWMESLGVDITSSSLGYARFDPDQRSYTYADMDGKTTIVARAANLAFERGITTLTSAGNERSGTWKYITSPGDAFDILTVGAVTYQNIVTSFSSMGPTSDGRKKPEIVAMGSGVINARYDSKTGPTYNSGGGTSYSAPIAAGVAALLKSSHPHLTNRQIRKIMIESTDNTTNPDNDRGYGLVSARKAVSFPNLHVEGEQFILHKIFIDEQGINNSTIKLHYRIEGGSFQTVEMTNDGNLKNNYLFSGITNSQLVEFYFTYELNNGMLVTEPQSSYYNFSFGSYQVNLLTDVFDNNEIPSNFYLYQNYPNPFNPITTIKYSIPVMVGQTSSVPVVLNVYDILGRSVATLVNEIKTPGIYSFKFNASGLPSGVYFYRLQSGSFSETKKLILLK